MMIGLPRVVALKYLKSAGKCHGMLLSTPITRFSPRAAIRLKGRVFFKATTLGKPIIMGRKTWDSLGRPLPGRLNIVVSRQTDLKLEGAQVFPSLDAAVARAEAWALEQGVDELMLIGGAQLYAQGLEQADRLYLTRVALSPQGDAWFPEFDLSRWKLVSNVQNPAEGDKPAYNFEVWEKA